MIKPMRKFLNEFNREISNDEIATLLDKHYHAENFSLQIGVFGGETILDFRHNDSKNHDRYVSNYLTTFLQYTNPEWKKLISKYDYTIDGKRCSSAIERDEWNSFSANDARKMRIIVRNASCLGFVSGADLVFTQFKNIKLLKSDDYLITRVDLVRWESQLCKTTKELKYI